MATITTKDGTHACRISDGTADEIAKKANGGAKFVECNGKWIAVSTITIIKIESPEDPKDPPSTPDVVNVHHNHYYSYSNPNS